MTSRAWPGPWAACALIGLTACSSGVAESNGDPVVTECQAAIAAGALPAEVSEASGIARDPRSADLFWVHNDSGHDPILYGVDSTGALAGTTPIAGATSRDPEDITVARCPEGWCLYFGDTGDNGAVRRAVEVHRLPLPPIPTDAAVPSEPVSPLMSYTLIYPGGPRDAEGLFVDWERGELGIVTKGREGRVDLFVADLETLESVDGPVVLDRVGRLPVPVDPSITSQFVTAADLSPGGSRLAVRSYSTLYMFDWAGSASFDTLAAPQSTSLLTALEPQGEGLTFTADGSRLYMASEGVDPRPPQLSRIDCGP